MKYKSKENQKIVELFKSKNLKPEEVTIFFDMDNTLCLFSVYGKEQESLIKMYSQGFYRNLQCFSEAPYVVETLQKIGFHIKILSACIETPFVKKEKYDWIKYHFPTIQDEDIILVPANTPKSTYITDIEHSILVDDFGVNIQDVYDAGGIGIKKSYSQKERDVLQIHNLIEIFAILHQLNCL